MDLALPYGLNGDIELDHGYSFAHQITMFFPTYFQKQIIKSQFSLYDVFAGKTDPNENQKNALISMTKVDTNIFRDISTQPKTIPSDDSIDYEMRNAAIKIIRMKSAHSWLCYVCLTPSRPDWLKKQHAVLSNVDATDSLLASAFNYLDVNDLASVNQINEDSATEHRKNIERITDPLNPHNQFRSKMVGT